MANRSVKIKEVVRRVRFACDRIGSAGKCRFQGKETHGTYHGCGPDEVVVTDWTSRDICQRVATKVEELLWAGRT